MSSSAVPASPATSPSPTAVHEIVCEFVTAQAEAEAEANGGWAGYRGVFLSAEVQDLIRSRLAGAAAAASPAEPSDGVEDSNISDGPRSTKKHKLDQANAAPAAAPAAAVTDEVSWTVCCCDGATFSVALPDHARVAEAKRAIGVLREVSRFAMELFVKGEEEPLDDERRLSAADKVPLFMLPKEASDRLALEAVFKSCGGADWERTDGWMTEAALGEWYGVTVDAEGRVVELDLYANNLAGALPSEIQQLSALTFLGLGDNQLTGAIPVGLGQLRALKELYLYNNQLSSAIPAELTRLPALWGLHLNGNQLSGAIPVELARLPALQALYLHDNQLSGLEAFRSQMQEHNPKCELVLVLEDGEGYEEEESEDDEEESEEEY
jgi:hypothetical protein